MFQLRQVSGLAGEEDRAAAASYCGQKFGITSADFRPCVEYYVQNPSGDYRPAGSSAPTPAPTQSPPIINIPGSTPGMVVSTGMTPGLTPSPFQVPPGQAWYTQWWGIGLLAVGAFLGYQAFFNKKPKSAAA